LARGEKPVERDDPTVKKLMRERRWGTDEWTGK